MLARRVTSQLLQLQALVLTVLGLKEPTITNGRADLVRDDFGLHKIIVAVTSVGKVGCILSWSYTFFPQNPSQRPEGRFNLRTPQVQTGKSCDILHFRHWSDCKALSGLCSYQTRSVH